MVRRLTGVSIRFPLLLLVLAAVMAAQAVAAPSRLEGVWRLAEQGHRSGRAGDASIQPPVRMECTPAGPSVSCRVWSAEVPPRSFEWPAFVAKDGAVPVKVVSRNVDAAAAHIRASYIVDLPGPGDRKMSIVEDYHVVADGTLAGAVRVKLIENGEDAGSYTLRRRFERER